MPTIHDMIKENGGINPFTDPDFNNCILNDVAPYDLAERVGLSTGGGGSVTNVTQTQEGDSLWKKKNNHIYNKNYREGCVGMGTNSPDDDYYAHVEGDFLVRARTAGVVVYSDLVGREAT